MIIYQWAEVVLFCPHGLQHQPVMALVRLQTGLYAIQKQMDGTSITARAGFALISHLAHRRSREDRVGELVQRPALRAQIWQEKLLLQAERDQ